ncbi:hypothetical protein [Amycolatopsis vastitatis]|uniref:Rv3651-like N-terminal domain-containing protein n=1 Tax=Amycolatopsis vastitatis TaxID=1905142 RepID=A0A229SKR7_9PSEU|nr:hypothetical protein [Amycolatopsis vastitatis]OXM59532.1 hypothetical protein CF165_47180 [Amycolatopsis vastitatis]
MSMTASSKGTRHAGQWLALDEDGMLYAIGETLYTGVSINHAGAIAKRVVAPLIDQARKDHREQRATRRYGEDAYQVWVKPALGGRDGALIGILACYVPAGEPFPSTPAIATWEWEEPPAGSGQPLRHWWGEDAPRLYGVEPPSDDWHGGESGRDPYRFMDGILTEDFRVATTAIMQDFRDAEINSPLIKFMEQLHVASGTRQGVRAVGRKKGENFYAGFSMRVDLSTLHKALPGPLLRQLGAYAAIITDPLVIIDTVHDAVVMTSDDYPKIDVPVPANSSLRSMIHPEQVTAVIALLHDAAARPGKRCEPVEAGLRTAIGAWRWFRFHAVGISDSATPDNQFVMCRLESIDRLNSDGMDTA